MINEKFTPDEETRQLSEKPELSDAVIKMQMLRAQYPEASGVMGCLIEKAISGDEAAIHSVTDVLENIDQQAHQAAEPVALPVTRYVNRTPAA